MLFTDNSHYQSIFFLVDHFFPKYWRWKTKSGALTFSSTGLAFSGRLAGPPCDPFPLRLDRPRLPKLMSMREVMSFTDFLRKLPSSMHSIIPLSFWYLGQCMSYSTRGMEKNLRPIWRLQKDFKIHDPGLLLLLTKYCTTKKLITLNWILKCQPSSSWKRRNDLFTANFRLLTSCCLDWWMTLALVGILSSALRMLNSTLGRLTSCRAFHSSRDISTSILTSNSASFSCALKSR